MIMVYVVRDLGKDTVLNDYSVCSQGSRKRVKPVSL